MLPWGYGMMGYGAMGWAPLVFWLAIVLLIMWAMIAFARSSRNTGAPSGEHHISGLEIIEQRYARGEINREEYLQKKNDIAGVAQAK